MSLSSRYISSDDLYVAYRKAKVEAFYEKSHLQALEFTEYEQNLFDNLSQLHERLIDSSSRWPPIYRSSATMRIYQNQLTPISGKKERMVISALSTQWQTGTAASENQKSWLADD